MSRTLSLAAAAAALSLSAPLPALACAGFEIHDPYVRVSTMMSQSGAAFMVIHNHSDADCHIAAVRSDVAARTELHTHREDAQGVMRMIEVTEGFPLPAQGELLLERGGHHVMFLGLNQPLADGATVAVTFVFADGAEAVVDLPVDSQRQPAPQGQGQAPGHNHMHGHSHGRAAGN